MNYKSSKNFEVAGYDKESVTIATYEDGSIALVAFESTEYMKEHSIDIPLTDADQVAALIKELQAAELALRATRTEGA